MRASLRHRTRTPAPQICRFVRLDGVSDSASLTDQVSNVFHHRLCILPLGTDTAVDLLRRVFFHVFSTDTIKDYRLTANRVCLR